MDKFLKRKAEPAATPSKKPKREDCPHKENCYRKNPHHFKEYEHPHLMAFIEKGDALVLPTNLPQPKEVYLEQIKILKPIVANKTANKTDNSAIVDNCVASSSKTSKDMLRTESKIADKTGIVSLASVKVLEYNKNSMKGTMLEKLEKTAPYNLFFTQIPKSPDTLKGYNSATFTDILCPSLGVLKDSLQINFMIDISWLLEQYQKRNLSKKPLTILYGDEFPDMDTFMNKYCPNIKYKFVKMNDPFGCHHSKIGIYVYEDNSLRVVISTANLYYEDWNHYNQGFWMSPECPKLPEGSSERDGESPTDFKAALLNYLKHYNYEILGKWIDYVKNADFSSIKVFFIASTPGRHYPNNNTGCHLHRVGELLSKHCNLPAKTTPDSEGPLSWGIVAQASSIGSMGKSPAEWFSRCLLRCLASHVKNPLPAGSHATLNLVYPSVDNVMTGYFGLESGGCLPYSKQTNEKQRWLQMYMHQWKADGRTRTRAMPHIKSYTRISPCLNKLAYFLLTSANLSKSAWGGNLQRNGGIYVRSYEVGVMFLPKFFDEEYFEINRTLKSQNKTIFPLMYDLPLVPYRSSDYPWCN